MVLLSPRLEGVPGRGAAPAAPRLRRSTPLLVGLLGFGLSAAGSWIPSLWFDEAATVSAATRSVPDLIRMLGTIDSVHAVYYLLMHGWFAVVGYSPFTLRLPSALAIAATAALLVVLARRIVDARTAWVAGVVFCLLPRTTWMGTEGRSYALGTLLAVVMTLALVAAQAPGGSPARRRLRWAVYGAVALLGMVTFLYLGLLVLAHGVALAASRRRPDRRQLGGWLVAAAAAAVLVAPLALLDVHEAAQISWIQPLGATGPRFVLVGSWFLDNVPFAVAGWLLLLAGGAALIARRARALLALAAAWLLVPATVLVLVTLTVKPVFSPRYVAFSAPAVALLVAVALTAGRRRWLPVLGIALCAALTVPSYVEQRTVTAKQDSSWAQVAQIVQDQRAAEPGGQRDAVIYGPLRNHPDATMQVLAEGYPSAFAGMTDLKAGASAAERGTLWQGRLPLTDARPRVDGAGAVWLVTSDKRDWRPGVTATLAGWGYRLDREWHTDGVNLLRFEPASAAGG